PLTCARLVDWIGTGSTSHRCLRIENLASINPNLDADLAECRLGFGETIINIRSQSVQWQLSLEMPLTPGEFRSVQTTTDLPFDSLRAKSQRLFDGLSHGATKSNSLLQ